MNQGVCGNKIGVAWELAFPILDSDANAVDLRPACRCVYRARQTPMTAMMRVDRRPPPAQLLPFSFTSSLHRGRTFFS